MRYVKEKPYPVEIKKAYTQKPKAVNLKVVRTCLNLSCKRSFIAPTRFIRLCDCCAGRQVYG